MPPMTWDEVYQMYCLTAVATSEKGCPEVGAKGVQGILGADPWLSLRGAAREMRHLRAAGDDSQGFAGHAT